MHRRRGWLFPVVVVAFAGASTGILQSSTGAWGKPSIHTFEGSCAIAGRATFSDPIGLKPRWTHIEFDGAGFCAGTLDGTPIPEEGAPIQFTSAGPGIHSCEFVYDPNFTFELTFYPELDSHVTIYGTATILDIARPQVSVFRGQGGGYGVALGQVQGHMETLKRCAQGTLRSAAVGLQIDTITPLKSSEAQAS